MRDELGHCARSAGVHPGKGEPRSQPWSSNAGGADAKYTGFTVGGPTDKSTVLVDVTYPTARAPTNKKQAKRSRAAGATAEFKEQDLEKIVKHGCVNVALLNDWSFMPAAQEKDTLHWGKESVRDFRSSENKKTSTHTDDLFTASRKVNGTHRRFSLETTSHHQAGEHEGEDHWTGRGMGEQTARFKWRRRVNEPLACST